MSALKWVNKPIELVNLYVQRSRSRKELANLDKRMLKDIGVSRADQIVESNKPFWKK